MKKLDCLIYVFSIALGLCAAGIVLCVFLCKENSDLSIAIIVAISVLTLMSGIILAILLLMKKQILPEEVHNENKLNELLAKMVIDSSIEKKFKETCDEFTKKIDCEIENMGKQFEILKTDFNEHKRKIEEK